MKNLIIALVALLAVQRTFATVEGLTNTFIVVQNIQDDEDFFVERVPVMGCWGLSKGPQLSQFTKEYKVNSNMGCGGEKHLENINYLTCAQVVSEKESPDYSTFNEITLDISKCSAKENPKFLAALKSAASQNFSTKKYSLKLHLIK